MKITPVLVVPSIEAVLPLWDALGFARTTEMPHGEHLGFVILARDSAEVMYQSEESVRADEPRVLEGPKALGAVSLFVQIEEDLDALVAKLPPGTDIFVQRRETPYGAIETFVRDAAGNVIVLAQFKA